MSRTKTSRESKFSRSD